MEHPCELVEFYNDVIQGLPKPQAVEQGCLDPEENHLGLIKEPRDIDELMEITGLNIAQITTKLHQEIAAGRAKKWPGNAFSLPLKILSQNRLSKFLDMKGTQVNSCATLYSEIGV